MKADDAEWLYRRPAVLADGVDLMLMLVRLRTEVAADAPERTAVMVRWADVFRRFSPVETAEVLDSEPLDGEGIDAAHLCPEAVRCATWLEVQRTDDALRLVPRVPVEGGAQDLLYGRIAYLQQDFPKARAHWERAEVLASLDRRPLAVEVRAEALGFLGRLAIWERRNDPDTWRRLDAVCASANAKLSQGIARLFEVSAESGLHETLAIGYAVRGREVLEKRYAAPYAEMLETVAPIPIVVHGAAKEHPKEPREYANALFQVAALMWRMGDRQKAYEVAWYGQAVGRRLFGDEVEQAFEVFIDGLLEPLESGARDAFQWRLKHNSDTIQREKHLRAAES